MSRLLTARLAAATVTLSLLAAGATSASADEATDAPVTADDRVVIDGHGGQVVDVLANDTDPNGDQLEICRIKVPKRAPLYVEELDFAESDGGELVEGEQLFVGSGRNRNATFEITYWACDEDYLTPATLTVVVKRQPSVKVNRIGDRPGLLKFSNPTDRRVVFLYGSFRNDDPDGRVALAPHSSARERVHRHAIDYVAFVRRTGEPIAIGHVRGIRLPAGDPGPPAQPHDDDADGDGPIVVSGRELAGWRAAS